jgi:uncharacterized protein YggE
MFTVLLGIFMVYGIIFTGVHIKTAMQESRMTGFSDLPAPTISVSATGTASAVPDIATVDMTVTKSSSTATQAQSDASAASATLLVAIKALGIEDADLTTSSFSTNPVYDYDVSPATIASYESTQTVTIKIRNTDLTSAVLDAGPKNGATNVSGIRYEVDDTSNVEQEARVEAVAKAKTQAENIAKAMHVRLGRVVSYNESTGGNYPIMYDMLAATKAAADTVAPPVEVGSQETNLTVNITYSIF